MFLTKHINFMAKRKIAMIFSAILILISVGSLVTRGLNLGVDFTGGTVIQVGYPENANITQIRETLTTAGYDAAVQPFGTAQDVLIRLPDQPNADRSKVSNDVIKALQAESSDVVMKRVDFVGPQIGDELRDQGGIAMLLALGGILIYIALRFEFRFSVGSIIALLHDVVLTIGFFSVTGIEFDLTILAAILAIIGYSLNDTIVVFDRIRENFLKLRKAETDESIDTSINETLSRTLVTSFTTLLVLVSLFFFGGEIIHGFSIAMIVGIVIGTYSSIYVASSSLLMMGVTRETLLPPAKDEEADEELDAIP
ncbi:protein translocase subunit SecF [Leucothrix pacifica]|uniref:Protein-export membrane protein SecF n=1 Tax=Leucothrix pacifica TaxID=1247513 RepID=A0A317CKP7_9GAMM|nr:protein translocase subunit SecF [Leucothrix pacifica]PWQ99076.1 protein translocase subunit SecF [Leucothrix pacifica]